MLFYQKETKSCRREVERQLFMTSGNERMIESFLEVMAMLLDVATSFVPFVRHEYLILRQDSKASGMNY